MAGILDLIDAPKDSLYGLLNKSGNADDVLNSVPGYGMRAPDDPYAALDKKQKEEIARKAALGVFDTGGKPDPMAGLANSSLLSPGALPFGSLAPSAPPSTYGGMIPVGGAPPASASVQPQAVAPTPVPMPQPRPAEAPPRVLPPAVADAQASAPAQQQGAPASLAATPAAAPAAQEPSIFSRVGDKINQNANLLIGLGAGMAGAPSIGTGISRGLTGASAGSQLDQKQAMQQGAIGPTYRALVSAGVPPQQALAAVYNPTILKSVTENYLGDRKAEIKSIKSKDMFGNETERLVSVNPYTNESKDVTLGGAKSSAGGLSAGGTNAVLAPGVTMDNFNHAAVGDEYLKQFQPEIQDAAKSYLAGQVLPTGRQGQAQAIKIVAQKYGADMGIPADDTAINQRRQWATSLGNTQSGVGLQSKGFQQGLEHFSKLSDNLVKMNLSNGLGIEPVAGMVNAAKNLTTEQQELVHKSDVIGQALSREMGNLFSKNGGGVHEAAETKKNVSNSTMSSKAAAGSLEAIDELMQGGLKTLEQRRDELFPAGNAPKGSQFMGPEQQAALEHIRNNIAILKGEKAAAPSSATVAPAAALPAGWSVQVR